MQTITRKHFDYSEKADAVKSILSGDKTRREVKEMLGVVKTGTITNWIKDYLNNRDKYYSDHDKNIKTKYCPRCGNTLPVESFWRNRATQDGYQCYCKDCMLKYREETSALTTEVEGGEFVDATNEKINDVLDTIIGALIDLKELL